MKCFLYAMAKEAEPLLSEAKILSKRQAGFASFYECKLEGKRFIVGVTGMGKVFAGSGVASALHLFPSIDAILNIGVGGSLDAKKAPLLSVVIGERYAQHDMDSSAIGDPVGFISGIDKIYFDSDKELMKTVEAATTSLKIPTCRGTMTSGDTFYDDTENRKRIQKQYGSLSVDMESAAMAQIAFTHHVPFVALRVISDTGETPNEYARYVLPASALAKRIAIEYLKNLED